MTPMSQCPGSTPVPACAPTREAVEPAAAFGLPSGRGFVGLLEAFRASGGTAPGEIVDRLLQEHGVGDAAGLTRLIGTRQVFGFDWRGSLWIPMFQFETDDLAIKDGARRVRAELPLRWTGWALATWFAGPNARLAGRSPAAALGVDLDGVVRAARSLASVDALPPQPARRSHEVAAHV